MKSIEFVPVDYDYFDFGGENYVKMIGRDSEGKKVCVAQKYDANFYLILEDGADEEKIIEEVLKIKVDSPNRTTKVLNCELVNKKFLGESFRAIRVFVTNHKDLGKVASETGEIDGIKCRREFDLNIVTKYIKEKGVEPLRFYEVEVGEDSMFAVDTGLDELGLEDVYLASKIKIIDSDKVFSPKVLAYDIETGGREIGEDEIFMISYSDGDNEGVITWRDVEDYPDYVEKVDSEASMIEVFAKKVQDGDYDILTGYFSDGFDLPYLNERAKKFKIKLDLGVDGKNPSFAKGRIPSGKINGLVHVDLFRFIDAVFSQYLQSETMSLNEVAGELVGSSKEDFDFARLKNMKEEDWLDFFSYSLQDARVTHKLAMKLWPDINEFCRIVKEPVFDVTRDRMSAHVENHIIHNLDRFNEIAERRPGYNETNERRGKRGFEGAYVFEPVPGFYNDIAMFDFTSMHSSLIVSYNISGQTIRNEEKGIENKEVWESPEFELDEHRTRVYFDKEPGFFSTLLSEIVDKRKEAKLAYKQALETEDLGIFRARSNAYKLLANATFGYQGFYGARYYSYEAAAATLAFVRQLTHDTMDKISSEGYKIIYGDTDSIVFLCGDKKHEEVLKMLKEINLGFPGIIELDLEGFFKAGLFVAKRDSKVGAKKKYALIGEDNKIKIRGFETVRRDWCPLSRRLQDDVLRSTLRDGNEKGALKIVREVVNRLKKREVAIGDLIIKTKMKRDVGDYTAEGPHVAAAKKMIDRGDKVGVGTFVEYYVGEGAGKKVGDRVFLVDDKVKYDTEYYLKKQVLPAVEGIFDVFGVDVLAEIEGERQEKLF